MGYSVISPIILQSHRLQKISLHLCAGGCHHPILERLAQDLQDVAAALREFIQKEHAVVRPRHVAGHRHLPAADPPHIGDGVRRGRDTAAW
jgi:hypothetical protein